MSWSIVQADCLEFLRSQTPGSLDLVFGSPPYEQARLYLEGGQNLGVSRKTTQWVEWMVEVYQAAQAACKGLVAFVVAGQTKGYRWSAGPPLLMAELHKAGMNLRNPPIFSRVGIPGSGGPDWLRGDYEWIVCTSQPGKLPWSNNTAAGHPPKWGVGGAMSNRISNGTRVNQWGLPGSGRGRKANGERKPQGSPSHKLRTKGGSPKDGCASQPVLANPGNIIHLNVGGGVMGHELAHENEAPFPLKLAEFFVLSFAPPKGKVCDPFSGSGTTAHAAVTHGRDFVGCDLRLSQVDLAHRRLQGVTPAMF
jgi:hypothetical protein